MTNDKKNIHHAPWCQKLKIVAYFAISIGIASTVASPAQGAPALRGGVNGGYSMLSTSSSQDSITVHGGAIGGHLQFHFNDTWAIGAEGSWSGFADYQFPPLNNGQVFPPVTALTMVSTSLGALYKIDVMRITPYIYGGLAPLFYKHTILDVQESYVDLALRLDFGIDIRTVHWLEAGLAVRVDSPLLTNSPYGSHLGVLLRLNFVWEWQEFGEDEEER